MAAPEVRQRIRDGMQAASSEAAEVQMLRLAWAAARPASRTRFLLELTRIDSEPAEPIVGRVGWLNGWRLSNSMTGPTLQSSSCGY